MTANRLKDRRVALGYSLRNVEEITKGRVSNAYLSQIENGKITSPSLATACDLAAAYGTSIEQLAVWLGMDSEIGPPALCSTCGQALPSTRVEEG